MILLCSISNNILNDPSKKLQEGDIFSIRRYGKYKYIGIIKQTKSGNFLLEVKKYI